MKKVRGDIDPEAALELLAVRIVARRKAKALTQEETAYRSSVALRTYQNLEAGRLNPSYLVLKAVAIGLELPLSRLLHDL